MIDYFCNPVGLNLPKPKFLLSFTGDPYLINEPLLPFIAAFQQGLITTAESIGAWILTDGLDSGVAKLVGEVN